jgi:glycosyltransferase involved in cell wall biosynthesis
MRIAVVSAAYPFRGGIARFTDALTDELTKRQHSISVFTFKRQYPALLFPGKTQYDSDSAGPKATGRATIDSLSPFSWYRTANEIAESNPEMVLFNYWMPFFGPAFGTIARLVKKRTDAKIVFICHNVVPHEKRFGDASLTKFALTKADRFIVMSETVGLDLRSVIPDAEVTLTPHPVYDSYGEPVSRDDARQRLGLPVGNIILFFGLIRKYKGLQTLLDALPLVLQKIDCHLVVAGEFYDDEATYLSTIRENMIEDKVTVIPGFVPNDKVREYFGASDVVVLPYKSATQSGIVQIATHFDRACIVTNTGGLSEMVRDNQTGFVVPVNNPRSLADAIVRFFENGCQQEFETAIRGIKESYSWSGFAEVVEESV